MSAQNDQPPPNTANAPIDRGTGCGDDGDMEARIAASEKDVSALKTDVAIIRSNYATKEDLQRELHAATWRIIGAMALLTAAVFFLARNQGNYPPPCPQQVAAPTAQAIEQPKAAPPVSR